jgi:oxygen-independent coproporphyrinogen-3 oxidase
VKYDAVLADRYIDVLIKHARQFKGRKINSIYIGGGTPSTLSLKQIQKLLQPLNDIFNMSEIREFTFELNPESASKEKLSLLRNLGVNRLSIGLQSVENDFLKFLGRIHDFKTFCNIYDAARKEGFNNINIDLIYGFQGQTLKNWEQILERILLFDSEHLSLYPLSVEEGTVFYKNAVATNDDIQRNMYDRTVEILDNSNNIHYEISNWSKKGKESFHNSNYWRNLEYIGLGAGAAGYLGRRRYKNVENIEKYADNFNIKSEDEYIDDDLYRVETIMLGIRLLNEGLNINCFDNPRHNAVLLECLENKMLIKERNRIKLAREYIFVFNQIVSKFMQ